MPRSSDQIQHARTRLAPSPTGALHLGNARTFLINWALARRHGWSILLRIEDLDGPRVKPGAAEQAVDLLEWLGVDWDDGPVRQSADLGPYSAAMRTLREQGLVYPHAASRAEAAAAASAPHPRAPGSPRPTVFGRPHRPAFAPGPFDQPDTAHRFAISTDTVTFDDAFAGTCAVHLARDVGDFVVWRHVALPSYQLAVTVDDARQRVTHIVRADDLVESAAQQIALRRALALPDVPYHAHVPLVVGPDGRRLAKRHGDTRLLAYRNAGVPPERIVGLLARWCGIVTERRLLSAHEFADACSLDRIPRAPVVFSPEDEQWLDDAR